MSISTNTRLSKIRGASGVYLEGDPPSEEEIAFHPTRAVEGGAEDGVEWQDMPVSKRAKGVNMAGVGRTVEAQRQRHPNQFEFPGFENCLWALLTQAVPNRQDWRETHVSVELDNVTSIKHGQVAVSRSMRMSLLGARFFDKVEAAGISLTF
jgi:hypothetical protein